MQSDLPSITADVIVVGGGGSGLAAAAEAAKSGVRVILLEKNPKLGGSTAWSVGSYSTSRSPHQRRAGIHDDSPEAHFEDLGKFNGPLEARDNHALRRILVEGAPGTFEWLQQNGIVFMGPALEEPHRHPRMHNVVPGSKAYPYHLGRLCKRLGVEMRLSMRATALQMDDGRVTGVEAADATGAKCVFHARRAVVITSGDFSGSREMKARYASPTAAQSQAVNVTNTGDGQAMALVLGASVLNGDIVHGPIMRFVAPPRPTLLSRLPPYSWIGRCATFAMARLPKALIRPVLMSFVTTVLGPDPSLYRAGAVLINRDGARFTDELKKPAVDLVNQPGGDGYILMDSRIAKQFSQWPNFVSTAPNVAYAYVPDYRSNRPDIFHEAATLGDLARKLRVKEDVLVASAKAGGSDRQGLSTGPFIALGPVRGYMVLTEGGLKVNDRHEVLGSNDAPIPGLFAAGSAGQGGLLLFGHGHHLAWAFVSGRRAGRHAAASPLV